MKLGINGLSMIKWPLENDLDVCDSIGCKYLELWWPKLGEYLKTHTVLDLSKLFESRGIHPVTITSIEETTFRDSAGEKELHDLYRSMCEISKTIGCPTVEVVPSKMKPNLTRPMIIDETADMLNKLAEIGSPYGVKAAFEFVGCSEYTVNDLETCLEIMSKLDQEMVGMVIDTFHFYNSKSSIEMISQIKAERIVVVHLADGEAVPVTDLSGDKFRLLPGEGVIPIKDILAAIERTGYNGVASFETLRPEHWEMNPFTLAGLFRNKILAIYPSLEF